MDWYYVENDRQVGPVNDGNFNRLLKEGTVKPDTLVWRDGMEKWAPYSRMSIGAQAVAEAAAVQADPAPAVEKEELHYAGFWVRALARVIDVFLLFTINMLLASAISDAFSLDFRTFAVYQGVSLPLLGMSLLVQMIYFTLFLGRFGATPGKMACFLKVVRPDGGPLTYRRAFGRFFGEMLSGLATFFIGYIMAGFDGQKRALHDRVCDTRVVKIIS